MVALETKIRNCNYAMFGAALDLDSEWPHHLFRLQNKGIPSKRLLTSFLALNFSDAASLISAVPSTRHTYHLVSCLWKTEVSEVFLKCAYEGSVSDSKSVSRTTQIHQEFDIQLKSLHYSHDFPHYRLMPTKPGARAQWLQADKLERERSSVSVIIADR